ncbi:MAG: 2-isopropylmalate synthase, partial [Ruminococcus sp.]|nr:2-isopropylmalate synthase [Ruminococcus sp.]
QSGKGGIGYILETRYGYNLPKKMREELGYKVKSISDHSHKELMPDEVYEIFRENYVDIENPIHITETHFVQKDGIQAIIDFKYSGRNVTASDMGNGRLDAVSNALRSYIGADYNINTYSEHALEVGSASKAVSYVEIKSSDGESFWGTGTDNDIITSSVKALVSAVNNMLNKSKK